MAMNTIDKLLHSAKSSVPELPEDFSEKVMLRIEKEQIAILQPATVGKYQQLRITTGLAALVMATILFSYNYYELRMNGSLELLFFGTRYLGDFLGYLPWDLIIPSIILTAFSVWMINKSNLLKKGLAVTAVISYLITGIGGAALASTGVNEQIEVGITQKEKDWPWIGMFHHIWAKEFIHHPNFKMGKVEKIFDGSALVITPNGEKMTVQLPPKTSVEEGQILRISGQGNETVFTAQKVHICNPSRVMRYFGGMSDHHKMMKNIMKSKSCCTGKNMMRRMRRQ